ncbi:bZIP transcription factor 46 isoform X3 [Physcomitrium patens]|uniref:bZIP transcription factor 46 isoform X3 n=1 Tax=Physcomitrium patens TaxID=3218 RepID=UPI003CCDD08F
MASRALSPRTQGRGGGAGAGAGAGGGASNGASASSASNGLAGSSLAGLGSRFNSLARQSSIYSLTLDEFQNALSEPGKNFGSMNMDEFLKNIWTAEESQAMAAAMGSVGDAGQGGGGMLSRQSSLQRQGSITLPRTLSRKTVDEVWKDIHRGSSGNSEGSGEPAAGASEQERTQTFGEMTLEDFLVKAGVMREESEVSTQGFGAFVGALGNQEKARGAHGERGGEIVPTLSLSPANAMTSQATIEAMQIDEYNKNHAAATQQQQQQQADWLRSIAQQQLHQQQHMLQQQQQAAAEAAYVNVAAKRMGNGAGPMVGMAGLGMGGAMGANMGPGMGGGMTGGGLAMGLGGAMGGGMTVNMGLAPNSPPSPDSDGGRSGLSLSPMHYGLDGSVRGRKRGPDGPVEKVVERRQRRMIKNRESAARSRARKQAYTVELEAEVSQLKEENMRLRKQQEEEAERRKKQCLQIMDILKSATTVGGAKKSSTLRRTKTATW